MESSGGAIGILSLEGLESSVAQPRMTFGGQELYPSLVAKASALGFSLVKSHPFIDGNKRTGHAAVEVFLFLNGYEFQASVDEQERVMFSWRRVKWIATHSQIGSALTSFRSANL